MMTILAFTAGLAAGHFFGATLWGYVKAGAGALWAMIKAKLPTV
jgi:hypothetical protein